jgi:hypothetical protein
LSLVYPDLSIRDDLLLDDESDSVQRMLWGCWAGQRTWIQNPQGETVIVQVEGVSRADGSHAQPPSFSATPRRRRLKRSSERPIHCPQSRDFGVLIGDMSLAERASAVIDGRRWLKDWMDLVVGTMLTTSEAELDVPCWLGDEAGTVQVPWYPGEVWFIAEIARKGDGFAQAHYCAFVSLDKTSRWHALTGFYLPFCPETGQGADQAVDFILSEAAKRGGVVRSREELPATLQPQPGWFDDDRMVGAALFRY